MAELDTSFITIGENANKSPLKLTKRKELQIQRHSKKPVVRADCKHTRKAAFQCAELTNMDMVNFSAMFYSHTTKIDQDNVIAKFIQVGKKQTKQKPITGDENRKRVRDTFETTFFVMNQEKTRIRVCKEFFLKLLGIGRSRVENIAKKIQVCGDLLKEKRGGDKKSIQYGPKRLAVHTFLKGLKGRESHYGRLKSRKIYLPSEISSLKQLWKMYLSGNADKPVKYEFFRIIFKRDFRIGFGSPKTDACSFCERMRNKIKAETVPVKKQMLITELRIHKMRANAFYDLLNEKREGLKVLCFDHQQNQVLPKVMDQIAYYSRQLYIYNFTIVETNMSGTLKPDNVFIYTWRENQFAKNSSSCASAVFHALQNANMNGIDSVRLVSDACGGQNKNSAIIYMAGHWLMKQAPSQVQTVELLFPVRGHSFLPCDRVFGVLEKKLRKKERIYSPEEYIEIYEEQGSVRVADEDWNVLDFKAVSDTCLKKPLPIKIQENKRFIITRGRHVTVQAEPNYRNFLNDPVVITKKGQSFLKNASFIVPGVKINDAKKSDIKKLMMEHVGDGWDTDPQFNFLKSVVADSEQPGPSCIDSDEEECDCLCEDPPTDNV